MDINSANTSVPMAKAIVEEVEEVNSSIRLAHFDAWLVSNGEIKYNEDKFLFADKNFFHFFSFRLLEGNPDSVLVNPRSIVLTESTAKKYFGEESPIGKKLRIENGEKLYTVTGLMEDVPDNSHIQFDMLGSLVTFKRHIGNLWISNIVYTYIKINNTSDVQKVINRINEFVKVYMAPQINKILDVSTEDIADGKQTMRFDLQKITRIHLYSNLDGELEANGKALYIYTFGIIAILILIIACLNFMNLSTANSSNRAREVILRKVIGSTRRVLIFQFLTESVIFSFLALIFSLLIAEIAMPHFNEYLGLNLSFNVLNNPPAVFSIILFTLFLGIVAGSYPSFFISSYEPVKVLHGVLNKGVKNRKVRSVFVIFQFAVSILIIIISMVVFAQAKHMLNKDLGFEKERVLIIRRPDALKTKINDFKKEILQHPNIESVTNSNSIPGRDFITTSYVLENDSVRTNYLMNHVFVNHDFREAFGLRMVQGRFFSPSIASDTMVCVINEAAVRKLELDNVIGKVLEMPGPWAKSSKKLKIIGVVKDFNFESVDKEIEPLVISLMPGNMEGYLNVRLSTKGIDSSIKFLEEKWTKYTSEYPFIYFFLDKDFNQNYRPIIRTGKILNLFSLLSIFIACLGLFGLISFTSNQRVREIGIRKAVGATFYQIIYLLLKETIVLLLIASVIAWVGAYAFSRIWLNDFYFKISVSPRYFIIASGIVLTLAIVVVLYQFFIASLRNPGEALKVE
jgi:putative ABC transport system permease protein